jgi:hypothetical protein
MVLLRSSVLTSLSILFSDSYEDLQLSLPTFSCFRAVDVLPSRMQQNGTLR